MDVSERRPVVTVQDLDTLDKDEVLEGYHDGWEGWPCGDNRSRSYWHGWKNGMVDAGRMEMSVEGRLLAKAITVQSRIAAMPRP